MIKKIKTEKFEGLALLVPDDASDFSIESPDSLAFISGEYSDLKIEQLSDGYPWEILGKATEMTEEQCAEIVDAPMFDKYYFDYMNPKFEGWAGGFLLSNALESFTSLMRSLEANTGTWLIIERLKET